VFSLGGSFGLASSARLGALSAAISKLLEAVRERSVLWLPVAFASGIELYLPLPSEPLWWSGAALSVLFGFGALAAWRSSLLLWLCLALLLSALGFANARLRARIVAAPIL